MNNSLLDFLHWLGPILWDWSFLLTTVGLTGFWLAGHRTWWAWRINIGCQALWMTYAIVSEQYGFIIAALFYTVLFVRNDRRWTREHRAELEVDMVDRWKKLPHIEDDRDRP